MLILNSHTSSHLLNTIILKLTAVRTPNLKRKPNGKDICTIQSENSFTWHTISRLKEAH